MPKKTVVKILRVKYAVSKVGIAANKQLLFKEILIAPSVIKRAGAKREAKIARAALVLENISNLVLDGLHIDWPEADTVPSPWRFEKKIGNGTLEGFYPTYESSVPADFNAIYGRGLKGGYVNAPLVTASSPSETTFNIQQSSVKVK